MRDYLILVGNLILFVGGFAFLGVCSAYDSGGNPWYGSARGAVIGTLFGIVFGIGMQDRRRLRTPS
jgi:ABC-type uncharacterized transport system permease subunit